MLLSLNLMAIFVSLIGCGTANSSVDKNENITGNTNANYSNDGWILEQGEWTFLVVDKNIYKMRDDGTELQLIFESSQYEPSFLNAVGDKLYFSCNGIIEVDFNGANSNYIYDRESMNGSELHIYEGHIYLGVEERLSLKEDKLEEVSGYSQVNNHVVNFIDNYIYFYDKNENDLLKMKLDGTEQQIIMSTFDEVNAIAVDDEYIYATTSFGDELYRITLDGNTSEELIEGGRAGKPILLDGAHIYCNYYDSPIVFDDSCVFALIDTDGNVQSIIAEEELVKVGSTSNWIYYQIKSDDSVYRYNKESKQSEEVDLDKAKPNNYVMEQNGLFDNRIQGTVEESKEIILDNSESSDELCSEYMDVYSKIIEAVIAQEDDEKIYFRERYFSDNYKVPEDELGGVSEGYSHVASEFLYFLKDISNEPDGISELFIGAQMPDGISIIGVFSYDGEKHRAHPIAVLDDSTIKNIYYQNNGMIIVNKYDNVLSNRMVGENGFVATFNLEPDLNSVLDTNTLEWLSIHDW